MQLRPKHSLITTWRQSYSHLPYARRLTLVRQIYEAIDASWCGGKNARLPPILIAVIMPRSYRVSADENYAYFATWTVVEKLPLFAEALYRQIVLDSLAYLRQHKKTQLNAFVVMSTHLHAVLWPEKGVDLSGVMRDFKRHTSRSICAATEVGDEHYLREFASAHHANRAKDQSKYQVWIERSHTEAIYSDEFARQKIDYIHLNPVKAGLVSRPEDWPYSSARAYLLHGGVKLQMQRTKSRCQWALAARIALKLSCLRKCIGC